VAPSFCLCFPRAVAEFRRPTCLYVFYFAAFYVQQLHACQEALLIAKSLYHRGIPAHLQSIVTVGQKAGTMVNIISYDAIGLSTRVREVFYKSLWFFSGSVRLNAGDFLQTQCGFAFKFLKCQILPAFCSVYLIASKLLPSISCKWKERCLNTSSAVQGMHSLCWEERIPQSLGWPELAIA